MMLRLTLRTDDPNRLTVSLDGQPLASPTLLTDLPALPALRAAPYDQGRALTDGLGGDDLLARLRDDPDRLLLLDAAAAAGIPWEYAALDGRQLLACERTLEALHSAAPPELEDRLPEPTGPLLKALEAAIEEQATVEIEYYTAGRAHRTTRCVEPLRLEWHGDVIYLIAHCHLRGDQRVFRVDWIAQIANSE